MCERVNVLCGCGWGLLSVPIDDVPEECPVCDRHIPFDEEPDHD